MASKQASIFSIKETPAGKLDQLRAVDMQQAPAKLWFMLHTPSPGEELRIFSMCILLRTMQTLRPVLKLLWTFLAKGSCPFHLGHPYFSASPLANALLPHKPTTSLPQPTRRKTLPCLSVKPPLVELLLLAPHPNLLVSTSPYHLSCFVSAFSTNLNISSLSSVPIG